MQRFIMSLNNSDEKFINEYSIRVHQVQLNYIKKSREAKNLVDSSSIIKAELSICNTKITRLKEIKESTEHEIRKLLDVATRQLQEIEIGQVITKSQLVNN